MIQLVPNQHMGTKFVLQKSQKDVDIKHLQKYLLKKNLLKQFKKLKNLTDHISLKFL
jgi:hypothetical protein